MDVDSEYARTPSPLQRKTRCAPSSSSPPPPPPPAAPPRKPIVTVFDWDDTLCPSFWLYQHGVLAEQGLMAKTEHDGGAAMPSLSCGELRDKLARIETAALALLQLATQVGPVFIITAAKLAWVSACADAFLPHVKALLKTPSFHVVSAREWYQQQLRVEGTPLAWKVMTFDAVCAHLRVDDVYARTRQAVDFISVGDSVFERDACRTVHSKAPTMLHAKTLKFVEYPDADELLEQLKLTRDVFEQFCDYVGSLDLCVVRKDSNNQATAPSLELLQVTLPQPQPMPQTDSKSNDRHHHPRNHEHAHAHPHSHSHSPSHSYSNSPSHSQPARASAVQS
ncbi:TPA: hypothetical protein N0F65_012592 [Lagenidium giganteum]|uniref:Protein kinase n=1 Tax=Lagenidium giganteum TaxID=4803 RepID=A0AAV2YML0_9STRA|nr:TPA: hypothetical protein N0F65_012592 [Lagenidium giganteum]